MSVHNFPLKIDDILPAQPKLDLELIDHAQELVPDFAGQYELDHVLIKTDMTKNVSQDYFIYLAQSKIVDQFSPNPNFHVAFQDPADSEPIAIRELTLLTVLIDRLRSRQEIELNHVDKLVEARFCLEQASALLYAIDGGV